MKRARRARKGGFLPLIPLLAAAIPGILGTVAGAMDVAHKAKQLKGQGLRRRRAAAKKGGRVRRRHRRGRGVVGDVVSSIPLLGSLLGPLARGIGLGLGNLPYDNVHMKYGGALMPYGMVRSMRGMGVRGGLLSAAGGRIRRGHYRRVKVGGAIKRVHVRAHRVH